MSEQLADSVIGLQHWLEEKGILHDPVPECDVCGKKVFPNPNINGFTPYYIRISSDSKKSIFEAAVMDPLKMIAGRNPQKERFEYFHEKCIRDLEMEFDE